MKKIDEPGIWQKADGRYFVRTTAKCPETGKMKQKQSTLKKGQTKEEAIQKREELKLKIRSAGETGRGRQIITLANYAKVWMDEQRRRCRQSTIERYTDALGLHILPELGHIRLDALRRSDISHWVHHVETKTYRRGGEDKRYATSTVRGWWKVLVQMIRDAIGDRHLEHDPTRRVREPDTGIKGRKEQRTLSSKQLDALLTAVWELSPHRYAEVATLALTGIRIGELYALEWDDIDVDNRVIHVRRRHYRGEIKPPKNGRPRDIGLPRHVEKALDWHRKWLIRTQHRGLPTGLVFPSDVGGHRPNSSLQKALANAIDEVNDNVDGVDIQQSVSPHVFRRTLQTLLRTVVGVDQTIASSICGWPDDDDRMPDRYTHVSADVQRDALEATADRLPLVASTCGPGL